MIGAILLFLEWRRKRRAEEYQRLREALLNRHMTRAELDRLRALHAAAWPREVRR